ncbi:unnamed protein product, partial [Onchocerca ochengi]|uniref:Uncharacterized protein n=1 Tax=Onchocerca ochengi TaxID=42157 RepID=A0A182EK18_ONCOC
MNEQRNPSKLSQKEQKISHTVGFADPIQESISPSTNSMDTTANSSTADERQIIEEDITVISADYQKLNDKFSISSAIDSDK